MAAEFEMLEFELEGERGRWTRGRPLGRPGFGPRRRPVYDTWVLPSYPVYIPEPEPYDDEGPAVLQGTLGRLPAATRPSYTALGSVSAALLDARSNVPGLYLIEFTVEGRPRAYSGQSGNVRARLLQHQRCANMLGLSLAGHRVSVAPLKMLTPEQRRALEKDIHSDMFARSGGVLTNQRREFEFPF